MKDKNIIIFGINKFAQLLRYYVESTTEIKISAFTVNKKYLNKNYKDGLKVIPFEEIEDIFSKERTLILPAIGYKEMNEIRKKVFSMILNNGFGIASYIHPTVHIAKNSYIGYGNIILENTIIQPFVKIGNGNVIWSNVNISHHSTIGNFNYLAPSVSLSGEITIKNNCFLGNNCIMKNGIELSDYSLIGAAAYASENQNKYSVLVPNKSKVLTNKRSLDMNIE